MLQGLPEALQVYVTSLCSLPVLPVSNNNFKPCHNHKLMLTRSLRRWVFQGSVSEGETAAQRTGGIYPVPADASRANCPWPLALHAKPPSSSSLPRSRPEGKSQLLTPTLMQQKLIRQQQHQPCRSESLRQPQAGERQRLAISSSQSFRRGSE